MITGTLTRAIVITFGCVVPLPSSGALRANQSAAADRSAREDAGRRHHERLCARCHGDDGLGGELGPPIVARVALRSDEQLATLIRDGLPSSGMPGVAVTDAELRALVPFLRTLRPRRGAGLTRVTVETTDGRTLGGRRLNHSSAELQLLSDDAEPRIHLLRTAGERYLLVTSQVDWPTYNGDVRGNRYSLLDEIDTTTVSRLAPRWVFTLPGTGRLQVTPVVVDGIMYVTSGNECYALDAGSGRQLWHYQRPRTKDLAGDAAAGINRGVAVAGRRLFMVTDHAHVIALDRFTGALLWDTEMADRRQNYGATSAPLVVGDLVISGISGGDEGVRGFLAAFDQATGREAWRFWTVPRRGEPGSETWIGSDIDHPCAATWLTGTYDPDLDILYWPTGNPCPDYDGSQRQGDNLYSDSILALDPTTGQLHWYFQYTPHDLWDWDAQQPTVLIDREWEGRPRKLLLHANRNGFFYVLDRTDGTLLLAEPFVRKLTWASGIGSERWRSKILMRSFAFTTSIRMV
ncbi:MAG: pyrrolo-quinoline quinone [Acidobacteria bacterium]|nr:MAG: pyrrolo-quinoline quinone [Acidobacteriota bacterium]